MKSRYIISDAAMAARKNNAKVVAVALPRQMLILPAVAVLAAAILLIVAL